MSSMTSATATPLPIDIRLMRLGTRLLLWLLVLAGLGAAGVWLVRSPWFALRQIHLEGEVVHNSADAVVRHAMPLLRGTYLTMDLREARAAFESVPWVRRAEVRRVWPHDLVVRLEEHHPVAYWEREDADDLLVNNFGEVFEVNLGDLDDDNLPMLRGPNGTSQQVLAMWKRLAPEFALLRARIDRLALSDRGAWSVQLDRGARIEIGRGESDEIVARTQRFVRSVGQITARYEGRAIEYADLRHSDSYALRLAGMGTTTSDPNKPGKPGRKP
jgi:cell division protein FtsQ